MCPKGKMYNDAPDEFAESLDKGGYPVTLAALGGEDNPFVKEGIYIREEQDPAPYRAPCPVCGKMGYGSDSPDAQGQVTLTCSASDCAHRFQLRAGDCTYYALDHSALAEFVSKGIGCTVCRQFKKTGWQFGKLRGYDVYFACSPTKGMYSALESTPKSVLIIGKNTPELLPASLAPRVIYLSRLLYAHNGDLNFAHEAIEEKVPLPRSRGRKGTAAEEAPKRRQGHPSIQVYIPYYLNMMREWFSLLRSGKVRGQPNKDWIVDWLADYGPACNRRHKLTSRTIYRHIEKMTAEEPPADGELESRSAEFTCMWNGCTDENYIHEFSKKDISGAIIKAFKVAEKLGFKVTPMRGMDAAEYADKVAIAE